MKGLNYIGLLLMSMAPNMAGDLFTTCPRWHGIGFLCLLVSYIEVHRVFTCCKDHKRLSSMYFSVAATANMCFFERKELLRLKTLWNFMDEFERTFGRFLNFSTRNIRRRPSEL